MLVTAATFVSENPIIIILGFFSTLVGTIQFILSSITGIRTHKEKEELDRKTKVVFDYLDGQAQHEKVTQELKEAKTELDQIYKQMEEVIPKERKKAILLEQIKCEERIIDEANAEIRRLKNQLEMDEEESDSSTDSWVKRIKDFITAPETKEFLALLLGLEAIVFFIGIFFGDFAAKVLGMCSVAILAFFALKNYRTMQAEKINIAIHYIINIAVCLSFMGGVFSRRIEDLIWWFILVLFVCVKGKVLNLCLDRIVPLLASCLFMLIFVMPDYEAYILAGVLVNQGILIILNYGKVVKSLNEK